MPSQSHEDIRRLLKEFGLTADETITAYLVENKPSTPLKLRITLEDVTEEANQSAALSRPERLKLEVEGEVRP